MTEKVKEKIENSFKVIEKQTEMTGNLWGIIETVFSSKKSMIERTNE